MQKSSITATFISFLASIICLGVFYVIGGFLLNFDFFKQFGQAQNFQLYIGFIGALIPITINDIRRNVMNKRNIILNIGAYIIGIIILGFTFLK